MKTPSARMSALPPCRAGTVVLDDCSEYRAPTEDGGIDNITGTPERSDSRLPASPSRPTSTLRGAKFGGMYRLTS